MNETEKMIIQKETRKQWISQMVKESVSIPSGLSRTFKFFDSMALQSIRTRLSLLKAEGMDFTVNNLNDEKIIVTRKS